MGIEVLGRHGIAAAISRGTHREPEGNALSILISDDLQLAVVLGFGAECEPLAWHRITVEDFFAQ